MVIYEVPIWYSGYINGNIMSLFYDFSFACFFLLMRMWTIRDLGGLTQQFYGQFKNLKLTTSESPKGWENLLLRQSFSAALFHKPKEPKHQPTLGTLTPSLITNLKIRRWAHPLSRFIKIRSGYVSKPWYPNGTHSWYSWMFLRPRCSMASSGAWEERQWKQKHSWC